MEDKYEKRQTEKQLTVVLEADTDSATKVRQVIKLGFEQEVAEDLVERYLLRQPTPVYYERLTRQDYLQSADE